VCQLENENASISNVKMKIIIIISKHSIEFLKPQGKRKLKISETFKDKN
jgi:hypothetical protein